MTKITFAMLVGAVLTAGCSTTPPPPPGVVGEYRPINKPDTRPPEFLMPTVFDFKYRGDPEYALRALQSLQPQLIINPSNGTKTRATFIDIDLRQVTIETALKKMGEQGGRNYEIVYKSDPQNRRDYAYIRYLP